MQECVIIFPIFDDMVSKEGHKREATDVDFYRPEGRAD